MRRFAHSEPDLGVLLVRRDERYSGAMGESRGERPDSFAERIQDIQAVVSGAISNGGPLSGAERQLVVELARAIAALLGEEWAEF